MCPHGYDLPMKLKKTLAALLAGLLMSTTATVAASALEPHGTGIKMRGWLINNPDYDFSEDYKTSVWYENFTSLSLTSNDRNNVLRIAASQLGYHEGNSSADFDGMNTKGTGNYIEYARLLTPNYNDNSFEWCACFVNWCLNQAHFDKVSSEIGCWKWVLELKDMGMWQDSAAYKGTYKPKPADFIFFNWSKTNTYSGHIGYVLYTTATHVYTIEGNADDNVAVRSYALNDPCVIGYGTPPYKEGNEPTIDYSYKDGMPRGTYIVNSDTANLSDSFGGNTFYKVPLGSQVTLISVKGDYALVSYKSKRGYLPKDCLYLIGYDYTVSYDANGGDGAPSMKQIPAGQSTTIPYTMPTLEGDTFLGWSTVAYNLKVDYRPGDSILPKDHVVLYAVWENRSAELAKQATEAGLIPEYERPDTIRNSHAILPGTLTNPNIFTEVEGTEIKIAVDSTEGRVLSLGSSGQGSAMYVSFPYAEFCESIQLTPAAAEDSPYVILQMKNVSISAVELGLSVNGSERVIPASLSIQSNWQYAVFDISELNLTEELETIRLDWAGEPSTAGNTVLLSAIYFAPSDAIKDAVLEGKYVFPDQPEQDNELSADTKPVKPSTPDETETDPLFENDTLSESGSASTDAPDSLTTDTSDPPVSRGCASILRTSAWVGMVLFAWVPAILRKKDN